MQPPERPRPGYLQRVLVDGARPAQPRAGARSLLGGSGDGGFEGTARAMAPVFTYAQPAYPLLDAAPDSRSDAADAGPSRSYEFASPGFAATLPPQHRPPPAALAAGAVSEAIDDSDRTSEPLRLPPEPANARRDAGASVEAGATTPRGAGRISQPPAAPASSIVAKVSEVFVPRAGSPAVALRMAPPPTDFDPVARTVDARQVAETVERESGQLSVGTKEIPPAIRALLPMPAAQTIDAHQLRETVEGVAEQFPVDTEKLPPAIRALLPMLGRIRIADAAASAEVPAPSRKREEIPSLAQDARLQGTSRPRAPMEARPMQPVSRPSVSTAMRLRRTAGAQGTRNVSASADGAKQAQAADEPNRRPAQRIERVVTTRVVTRTPAARAFWERRYLGRPHMRAFR